MFNLTSFRDLYKRPILEALLEVEPESPDDANPFYKAVAPVRKKGRPTKTKEGRYLFDLPSDSEYKNLGRGDNPNDDSESSVENLIKNASPIIKIMREAGDLNHAKSIVAQTVLASLGLIDAAMFAKSKVIEKSNKKTINNIKNLFESFITKYRFSNDMEAERLKMLFSETYDKNAISDKLGFNIFDLFVKQKNWEDLFATNEKTNMPEIMTKIMRIYSGIYGLDQNTEKKYHKRIASSINSLAGIKKDKDTDGTEEKVNDTTYNTIIRTKSKQNNELDYPSETDTYDQIFDELREKYKIGGLSSEQMRKKWAAQWKKDEAYAKQKGIDVDDPNLITVAQADAISKPDKKVETKLTAEDEIALTAKIIEKSTEAVKLLIPLFALAKNTFIAMPGKDDSAINVQSLTPAQFNIFLTRATQLGGALRYMGIDEALNYKESIDESETIGDYFSRISSLLDDVTITDDVVKHANAFIAKQAEENLNKLAQNLNDLGFKGGLTISNVLEYLKSDLNPNNTYTRDSLEYNYGITPDELTTENFPTFQSFISALYRRGKYFHEWVNRTRKRVKYDDEGHIIGSTYNKNDERKSAITHEYERNSIRHNGLLSRKEAKEKRMADIPSLIASLEKLKNSNEPTTIIVDADCAFGRSNYEKFGFTKEEIIFSFNNVNRDKLAKIINTEKESGYLSYVTDEAADRYTALINSADGEQVKSTVQAQLREHCVQQIGRRISALKFELSKRLPAEIEELNKEIKNSKRWLRELSVAKFGYDKAGSSDPSSTPEIEDLNATAEDVSEIEDETLGYMTYGISTNDGPLIKGLIKQIQSYMFKFGKDFTVKTLAKPASFVKGKDANGNRILVKRGEAYRIATTPNTIVIEFPNDIGFAKNENGKSSKIADHLEHYISQLADTIIEKLDDDRAPFKLNVYDEVEDGRGYKVKVEKLSTSFDEIEISMPQDSPKTKKAVKTTADAIKHLGLKQKHIKTLGDFAKATASYRDEQRAKKGLSDDNFEDYQDENDNYLDEDEEIIESINALNAFGKFNHKIKLIPNKDRFRRGYLIQEQKYNYLTR